MISKEVKKELEKIRAQSNEPKDEEEMVYLVKNLRQIKVAIPKKFVDILKLDTNKHRAKFILHKKEKKLTMEIING